MSDSDLPERRIIRKNKLPLTEERKAKYLAAILKTANFTEAARIATPGALGKDGAVSTFKLARHADPEFDQACREAMAEAIESLEAAVFVRAKEGFLIERRTDASGGQIERWQHDSRLALAVLARHKPAEWKQTPASTHVNVTATVADAMPFDPAILDGFSPDERAAMRTVVLASQRVSGLLAEARELAIEDARGRLKAGTLARDVTEARIAHARAVEPALPPVSRPVSPQTRPNHQRYIDDPR